MAPRPRPRDKIIKKVVPALRKRKRRPPEQGAAAEPTPTPRTNPPAAAAEPVPPTNGHSNGHDKTVDGEKARARAFIWDQLLAASRRRSQRSMALDGLAAGNPYMQPIPRPPRWMYRNSDVRPEQTLAMDDNVNEITTWAGGLWNDMLGGVPAEGTTFMGYQYLSELAQRAEYRRACETLANESTRKWIKIQAQGKEDKTAQIKELGEELTRLDAKRVFREAMLHDAFFGRSHIYVDLADKNGRSVSDDRDELRTNIGDGRDTTSRAKIGRGMLKAIRTVEPVFVYPMNYDSVDPLKPSWYNPQTWFVMGKEVHSSRLLRFVGREVPDLIKPMYSFGGLSLIQMMIPYVNNWLRTRQSVSDVTHAYSVMVLATDLAAAMNVGGEQVFKRAEVFNNFRDNLGLMLTNKDTEELTNVAVPLGSLDKLQAQAQEQMAAVTGIPLLKLLGLSPAGLNATAEPELRSFFDWIHAFQELFFNTNFWIIFRMAQLNIWGDIDDDLTFTYEPLWALSEEELTKSRKTEAETDQILIDVGAISPMESRRRLASDPDQPYASLDIEDVPNLKQEEEMGLEPKGGRPQPLAEAAGAAPGGVSGPPIGGEGEKQAKGQAETAEAGAPGAGEKESTDMDMGGPSPLDDASRAEKLGRLLAELTREDGSPPGDRYLKFAAMMNMLIGEEGASKNAGGAPAESRAGRLEKFVRLITHAESESPNVRAQKLGRFLGESGPPSERTAKLARLIGSNQVPAQRIRRLARVLLAGVSQAAAADTHPFEDEPSHGPEDLEDVERETDPNLAPSAVSGVDADRPFGGDDPEDVDPLNPPDAGSHGSGGNAFGECGGTPDPTADPRESGGSSPEIDLTNTDSGPFTEALHPRGQPENAGQFVETPQNVESERPENPELALVPVAETAWTGYPTPTQTQLGKQETGAIGEKVVIAYLKSIGLENARPANVVADKTVSNYPIDVFGDHMAIEIKTAVTSSTKTNWGITIGQIGKEEKKWYNTLTPEQKKAFNAAKIRAAMDRKMAAIKELEQKVGHELRPVTVMLFLNPDTRVADLHMVEGYHATIGHNSPLTKSSRVGSFKYG